jgi:hypothetical protein
MKELQRGKYELPSGWTLENLRWEVHYDTIENGKAVTKILPLHPNCNNKAKVGEPCTFHIQNCPNLHNGGEWEDFAIVGNTNLQLNDHIFQQVISKIKNDEIVWRTVNVKLEFLLKQIDETAKKPSVDNTEEDIIEIL